ncbi:MAG: Smr/MutS family protein [Candidatus Sphingomonas phytovorans]|nr:Smr/MutS family protein [Sphingomonas sp.]WEK02046.1 MAG: Smr/MutS family protein [Sphingomonas sp.]
MADRPLTPDEAALWARVMASVRPIRPRVAVKVPPVAAPAPAPAKAPSAKAQRVAATRPPVQKPPAPSKQDRAPGNTLDGSWDRQLSRGLVSPDCAIDLHGHTLNSAYALLDSALDQAIRSGDRLVLLVTGKPPRAESERPHARGAIRAAVGDWLAGSRHATSIAAVRGAHPRHGGAGALYIILRRPRPSKS